MISDLDLTAGVAWADQGARPGAETRLAVAGVLAATDAATNRVKVSVNGGPGSWMPALPGQYAVYQTVWVLWDPLASRSVLCLGPTGGYPHVVSIVLSAIDAPNTRGTVSWEGNSYSIPYVASTYTVGQSVWVALDPTKFGQPNLIVGPAANPPAVAAPKNQAPPDAATVAVASAIIAPEWTGTYRSSVGRWQDWNANVYGRDVLYQGNGYGSGPMVGLATYGNRITDLGATAIRECWVTLRGANISAGSYPTVTIQGASNGAPPGGAPTTSGDTVSGDPGRSGVVQTYLTGAMCEALRTGAARGLATVGSGYAGVRGTGSPDGMLIGITYERPA